MAISPHPASCSGCPLDSYRGGFTELTGTCANKVLILGEASGDNEKLESRPFIEYAQAGSILEGAIKGLGLSRESFGVTNVLRCQPGAANELGGTSYEQEVISKCHSNLVQAIDYFHPKVILALGNIPLRTLTGLSGKKRTVTSLRGYVQYNAEFDLYVVPTYHPAFIARGMKKLLGVFSRDISKALKVASGELLEGRDFYIDPLRTYPHEYNLSASIPDINSAIRYLHANPSLPFAYDIETSESIKHEDEEEIDTKVLEITQFQVSWAKRQALVLPREMYSQGTFFGAIQAFMNQGNLKLGQNCWRFDDPVLRANGIKVPSDTLDVMTMFRHWQPDLPSDLQTIASIFNFPFPWKHLAGDNLPFYGACDTDSLMYIYPPLKALLEKESLW